MYKDKLKNQINNVSDITGLNDLIADLRVISANEKSESVLKIIRSAIKLCKKLHHEECVVNLYELEIKQLFHKDSSSEKINSLLSEMFRISKETNYNAGLTLAHSIEWGVLKLKGKPKKSMAALKKAKLLLERREQKKDYIYYVCKYSFALDNWLLNHKYETTVDFEECSVYFYKEGYYRSLAQTFGLQSLIYTRTHEGKRALDMSNAILVDRFLFEKLPLDVKGIIYYFTGLGHMLDANLTMAESYFSEAYNILKPIYKDSIYFAYYLVLLSYLTTIRGLQGKTEQALGIVKEAEELLQTEFIKNNLDNNSKKQITHTHNLTKFYNISRLSTYDSQEHQKLINKIIKGSKNLYSDFMTFSEFILNSELDTETLQVLLEIDNFSINRVKHLIEFSIEKQKTETEINQDQKTLNCISILKTRTITPKTTFMEHVYANLLNAQQLFSSKRYAEIAPLLKKYENRLNKIEVLEIRIFMEAFIQVGAFKNGDPLGPALQYMAIKKCRLYGFSKLENKLLDYLHLQHKEITRTI